MKKPIKEIVLILAVTQAILLVVTDMEDDLI